MTDKLGPYLLGPNDTPENGIYCGDVAETLAQCEADTFDGCLCDPPYGLGFMGRNWDGVVPSSEVWREVLRVLKPGAFLLAFGGTRTFHRLACAIEDAGFEVRDCMMHVYGSGFPKSHDISKAIDKAAGIQTETRGHFEFTLADNATTEGAYRTNEERKNPGCHKPPPTTPEAQLWHGYGTALKPAWEPIILAQKPRDGTFANNALTWGCGGLWIDGTRIGYQSDDDKTQATPQGTCTARSGRLAGKSQGGGNRDEFERPEQNGRWPANLLLQHCEECEYIGERRVRGPGWQRTGSGATALGQSSGWNKHENRHTEYNGPADPDGKETIAAWECVEGCPVRLLGEQSGKLSSGTGAIKRNTSAGWQGSAYGQESRKAGTPNVEYGDTGTAARFFYQAKASRSERNEGLDDFYWQRDKESPIGFTRISQSEWEQLPKRQRAQGNIHPTVKPLGVIEYIARLIMPPESRKLLVPFCGSGSEIVGAIHAGWHEVVGIDIVPEYCEMARERVRNTQPPLFVPEPQQVEMTL